MVCVRGVGDDRSDDSVSGDAGVGSDNDVCVSGIGDVVIGGWR